MPVFTFSGKTASGEKVQGERVASTKDGLASQLRKERITPGSIREKGKEFSLPTFGSGKVKVKEVAVFFRQFSVMIDAGLPLVQCLEILGANQENPSFQKTLLGVRTTVEGGATLANAMRQYPVIFDDLTTNMIEAGETGGILDIILQRLAIYVEKALPLPTRIVIGLSAFVGQFWWFFIVGGVGAVFGVKQIRKHPRGRYYFDAMLLKLPIIGLLLRKIAVARFTRTLGTLITSGVPI